MALGACMQIAQAEVKAPVHVDALKLYTEVTSLTMAFNEKYGKKFAMPVNAKDAVGVILKNSDTKAYMGTESYNDYKKDSQFAKDAHAMMSALEVLLSKFKEIGFIQAIKAEGKTPAIMFDIDNTIQLTSFDDDYWTKSKLSDPATSEFIKEVCFKDGVECYFITARSCNHNEAVATKSWLQKHLGLSKSQIQNYVFLSGSIPDNACSTKANEKVAYKDVLREALSEKRQVYWLMSIGDQMTDWFGPHSGLKVWYPNQMFDSAIVGNNHNDPTKITPLQSVVAPSKACYAKLQNHVLQESTIQYCQAFPENKYISIQAYFDN